jgi:hypothetical protein
MKAVLGPVPKATVASRRWSVLVMTAAAVLVVSVAAVVRAAPPSRSVQDPFLAQLAGRWTLSGAVLGKPVRYRGEARWVLDGGWLRLTLVDRATPPEYQADVYLGFDAKAGDYIAHWLDRFGAAGARVVATGRRDGQTLVLLFPYDGSPFRDTLTLAANGATGSLLLESQKPDGSWSTFASYALARRQ